MAKVEGYKCDRCEKLELGFSGNSMPDGWVHIVDAYIGTGKGFRPNERLAGLIFCSVPCLVNYLETKVNQF